MRIDSLAWKASILEKILDKHGVCEDEVMEVVFRGGRKEVRVVGRRRYLVRGSTAGGRNLLVVLEKAGPPGEFVVITARELSTAEKRSMRKMARRRGNR